MTARGERKRRPRRRAGRPAGGSAEVVRAVLDAALDQLGERGYAGLAIDDVARAAGVNKTTIYRRWPTKSALILAALHAAGSDEPPLEPRGDLRADLIALLDRKARRLATPRGRAIGLALVNLDGDPEMLHAVRAQRFGLSSSVIQRAIDHGELPRAIDPTLVSEMLLAPILLRVLLHDQPATVDYIAALVDRVLDSVAAGAKKQRRLQYGPRGGMTAARRSR